MGINQTILNNVVPKLNKIISLLNKIISLLELRNSQNEPKKSETDFCNCNEPRYTSGGYYCPVHGQVF